jgi:HSP20 family molecular chaperone IbpA
VMALQRAYIENECDPQNPFFSLFDRYWYYELGQEGSLFKLETFDKKIFKVKEGSRADFRALKAPQTVPYDILVENNVMYFIIECPDFDFENFDIILNQKHVIIYGTKGSKEILLKYRWDRSPEFAGQTLEEMKERLRKSVSAMHNGILQLTIPL